MLWDWRQGELAPQLRGVGNCTRKCFFRKPLFGATAKILAAHQKYLVRRGWCQAKKRKVLEEDASDCNY
jgi:hypothetical protein